MTTTSTAKGDERVTRDRSRTEAAILDAAKRLVAEQGFDAFGVNAIARAAGCDKQLVYRYFGGLDGLADAMGRELAGMLERELPTPDDIARESYGAFVTHLILGLLDAFRRSSFLLNMMSWEVLSPSDTARRIAKARGAALAGWVEAHRGSLTLPADVDAGAVNATLIAAVQYLALAAQSARSFGGVPLDSEADWERVRAILRQFCAAAFDAGR